jgi:hypothetical protein
MDVCHRSIGDISDDASRASLVNLEYAIRSGGSCEVENIIVKFAI